MKTSIGGDRLGSGSKQNVSLKNYNRSSHDMGYLWRSSMSSGTLVPFMSEVGLPGDSFDIDLSCEVLTLPTVGPLFGSYKVQLDVFSVPVRLYNAKLHMNKLNIGLDMSEILLPQLKIEAFMKGGDYEWGDNEQINSSCLFSYLNIRGVGRSESTLREHRMFNAIPYLGYWDIYKQYYANKQEDEGAMIHVEAGEAEPYNVESGFAVAENGGARIALGSAPLAIALNANLIEFNLRDGTGNPLWAECYLTSTGPDTGDHFLSDIYDDFDVSGDGLTGTWSNYNGSLGAASQNIRIDFVQSISGSVAPDSDSKPQVARFDLKNIDSIREDIYALVRSTTAYTIDEGSASPFGLPMKRDDENNVIAQEFNQEGLAIKTYQSDLFNNWISTEWIDGTNGINEITSVDTTGDSFTIDSLNLASKVYDMLNRIAISGGTYDDWLDAVYTHERSRGVENPVYHGSLIKELSFEEVISTADTDVSQGEQPLGTLAGRGRLTGKNKGGKVKIKCDEPCYVMGIVSITPRVDYSQGNKWDVNLKTMDDFHKPALDAIGYQDLITDQMAWFDTTIERDEEPSFKSAGKQPAWINYMTNVNQIRGNFASKTDSMFMTLNRRYESGVDGIDDLTTYVDPSKFNHIFADTRIDAQNFWVQISNKITARRKISAKVIPNL